jgi:drug/metabolite transporter (DMT)-like permease
MPLLPALVLRARASARLRAMFAAGSPIARGVALALLAAVSFGVTVPIIQRWGEHVGPFTTAALLYAGACLSAALPRGRARRGVPLARRDIGRLVLIALCGAAIAPASFAWGLQRTDATAGALLLNLEAPFTVVFARVLYQEAIGRRVVVALLTMVLGGVALVWERSAGAAWSGLGVVAVALATCAWALDNALTRPLAEHDPVAIVRGKALLGASLSFVLGVSLGERIPGSATSAVLLACGATGYGASLRLYILAQRRIGAARTGSIFALAPFVGAALAWLAGDRELGLLTLLAALLFGAAVWLHATERHSHWHTHPALEHEHPHRHDDAHHDHVHEPPFYGEHSHPHSHAELAHEHEHAPDVHHGHDHEHV